MGKDRFDIKEREGVSFTTDALSAMQDRTVNGKVCATDDARIQKAAPEMDDDTRRALTMWKMGLGNSAMRLNGEDPIPQKREMATKDSWKTLPMPEKHVTVPMDLRLTDTQMATVLYGHIPEAMEDHWFMYCADNRIHYHRSWTGLCIFEATFEESSDGFRISSLTINQDPEQFGANPEKATALFCALLTEECGGDAGKYWEKYLE